LGGTVLYAPRDGEPEVEVDAIFDAMHVRADAGIAGVTTSGPAVFLRLADLPSDPDDDDVVITVDGVTYKVREAEKDGQGGVLLRLNRREDE
jgi:hypothetical protein